MTGGVVGRVKACAIHFSLSLLIFSAVSLFVILSWYPSIYLETSGVWRALRMVALVDVALGPLMTLILFKSGKPGLKFDLSMVATVQVIALAYGVWVLHSQKPELTVFHDGMFFCLNQQQVDFSGAPVTDFNSSNEVVPIAILPMLDQQQRQDWENRRQRLPEGYPEHPAFVYGDAMIDYGPETLGRVVEDEWDLSRQLAISEKSRRIYRAYEQEHGSQANHAFFPLTCGYRQYMAAVERQSGRLVDALNISFLNAQRKRFLKPQNQ